MKVFNKTPGRYFLDLAISLDQTLGVFFGGDPDETISSRIGRTKLKHGGRIRFWRSPAMWLLDLALDKIDPGHSIDAIETLNRNGGKE